MMRYRDACSVVLRESTAALEAIDPAEVDALVEYICSAPQLFFIGVGRVALALQAMVKRLNHLDVRAWFVGDLAEPAITADDLLVVGSGSGESVVPCAIARRAKQLGARVIHIGSNPDSSLSPIADLFVRIPVRTRLAGSSGLDSRQIMTSQFEQSLFLLGDAVSLLVLQKRHIHDVDALWQRHANLE